MRKQYLTYFILVFGIFGTVYGTYLLIYHFNHGNGLSVPALLLLLFGVLALLLIGALLISNHIINKKKKAEPKVIEEETKIEEEKIEPAKEEPKPIKEEVKVEKKEYVSRDRVSYSASSSYNVSMIYVKQVGYGSVLRVEGARIIDMRSNTYYRIENNMVMQEGYGPVLRLEIIKLKMLSVVIFTK